MRVAMVLSAACTLAACSVVIDTSDLVFSDIDGDVGTDSGPTDAGPTDAAPTDAPNRPDVVVPEGCGDGMRQGAEACDDGNMNNRDNCLRTCEQAMCGDGFVHDEEGGTEACDDGNANNFDGCDDTCAVSHGAVGGDTGAFFSCLLTEDGRVRCFGDGTNGALGVGSSESFGDDEPARTAGDVTLGGIASQVSIGTRHSCAILAGGVLRWWGGGLNNRLGHGNLANVGDVGAVSDAGNVLSSGVTDVGTGVDHTCVIRSNLVRCFGLNDRGQVGLSGMASWNLAAEAAPSLTLPTGGTPVRQLETGGRHNCVIYDDQTMACWGDNQFGQLGYGNTENIGDNETPRTAGKVPVGVTVQAIALGFAHTCALGTDGSVRCWGWDAEGQLGNGAGGNLLTPGAPIDFGGRTVVAIAAAASSTCARFDDNAVRCWGDGRRGLPAQRDMLDVEAPLDTTDVNLGGPAAHLIAGGSSACAILTGGRARCWGQGSSGQLGYGNTDDVGVTNFPADVGDVPFFDLP